MAAGDQKTAYLLGVDVRRLGLQSVHSNIGHTSRATLKREVVIKRLGSLLFFEGRTNESSGADCRAHLLRDSSIISSVAIRLSESGQVLGASFQLLSVASLNPAYSSCSDSDNVLLQNLLSVLLSIASQSLLILSLYCCYLIGQLLSVLI